ncbi:MAG: hypothetical protein ACRDRO_21530 [Pseudonocardiaceae bacterium]
MHAADHTLWEQELADTARARINRINRIRLVTYLAIIVVVLPVGWLVGMYLL